MSAGPWQRHLQAGWALHDQPDARLRVPWALGYRVVGSSQMPLAGFCCELLPARRDIATACEDCQLRVSAAGRVGHKLHGAVTDVP